VSRRVFLAAAGLLIALGLAAEFRSYMGADTGFLLDEAARVLSGARLYTDLVEMNPPLIVVLNMGAVLLARLMGVPDIVAYRVGCVALLLATLALAAWLLRRLLPEEPALRHALVLVLVFALFNLAGQDFGEREHLLLALAVPYLLLAAARAGGQRLPAPPALLAGLMLGLGLALKPHFVFLWVGIEVYQRLTRRVSPRVFLPETGAIGGFLALYGIAVLVWTPDYLAVVRLLAGPYNRFLYVPFWQLLLTGRGALLPLFALLTYAALRRHARHPELLDVFAIGTLASLVASAAQLKDLRYHFYPAFGLALVVLALAAWDVRAPRGWMPRVYRILTTSVLAAATVAIGAQNLSAAMGWSWDLSKQQLERLLPVVRARAAGQSVYVMSYHIGSAYPLLNYSGARSASRFAQLWVLPAAYIEQLQGTSPLRYRSPAEMSPSERFLNQAVFEDLRDQRPRLLVILRNARDLPVNGFRRLDYVAYFGRDPLIARELARYQLVADLGDYLVYQRIPDGQARAETPPVSQPGTRDILQARPAGGMPVRVLGVLAFVVAAVGGWGGGRTGGQMGGRTHGRADGQTGGRAG
jgi:hypothetical protein